MAIIQPDSPAVDSDGLCPVYSTGAGAEPTALVAGLVAKTAPACASCGRADLPGGRLIERFAPSPSGPPPSPRRALVFCTGCVAALGLDWCVLCHEWNAAAAIDADTEACPRCRTAPPSGPCPHVSPSADCVSPSADCVSPSADCPECLRLVEDMREVERCYEVSDGGDGWLRFRGNVCSDRAAVWIPVEGDEPGDDIPVCLGTQARFPGEVYRAAAEVWLAMRDVREIVTAAGDLCPSPESLCLPAEGTAARG